MVYTADSLGFAVYYMLWHILCDNFLYQMSSFKDSFCQILASTASVIKVCTELFFERKIFSSYFGFYIEYVVTNGLLFSYCRCFMDSFPLF